VCFVDDDALEALRYVEALEDARVGKDTVEGGEGGDYVG